MKIINEDEWIMRKAEEEGNAFVSAGGLLSELATSVSGQTEALAAKSAFARFVHLARLDRKLSKEQFAERTSIPLDELLCIEDDETYIPRPRTVHMLANFLNVSQMKLLALAGLATTKEAGFSNAAIRFAAKSEPIRRLAPEEHEALEEFVRFLKDN